LLAKRIKGNVAAVTAAAATATTILIVSTGRHGTDELAVSCLIATAWFAWFLVGRMAKRWALAWSIALLLVLAAATGVGIRAFITFYIPVVFFRRPLLVWRRIASPAHWVTLASVLLLFSMWVFITPGGGVFVTLSSAGEVMLPREPTAYGSRLLYFPVACILLGLPWACLAWPGFCAAFRPLEERPDVGSFLRTLVLSLLIAAWLWPAVNYFQLTVVAAPLAVLVALHYQLLVRRHYQGITHVVNAFTYLMYGAGILIILSGIVFTLRLIVFHGVPAFEWGLRTVSVAVALVAFWALNRQQWCRQVWFRLTLNMTVLVFVASNVYLPIQSARRNHELNAARFLAQNIPVQAPVYKLTRAPMLVERWYMQRRVVDVLATEELPAEEEVLYVLGGPRPPILVTRTWEPCSPPVQLDCSHRLKLHWFPDTAPLAAIRTECQETQTVGTAVARVYRGVLRRQDDVLP
ncbi:MAG: hypothetical protein K9N51_02230, partial [Candidatus Pacebacteria bacterium]|nr:hypothetical protein [Candidatus Paceibacterota bacterium]